MGRPDLVGSRRRRRQSVEDVVVWDDGSGPALFVCGVNFFNAGGQPASKVAKWDGQNWSQVGLGLANGVLAIEVFNDGSGEALYACGNIWATADINHSERFSRFAKWDGQQWSSIMPHDNTSYMLNGQATIPLALFAGDIGDGPALYVGGDFCQVYQDGSYHDSHLVAIWRGCNTAAAGDLNCDGVVNFGDIDPFVLAMTDPAGYASQYPDCDQLLADINGDGGVNFGDIDPFVALLTQ